MLPTRRSIDGSGGVKIIIILKKKGLGSQLINGLTAWLAARSAFLRLLTLGLDPFQEVIRIAKCPLAQLRGLGAGDKENKDPSLRSCIPWEPLGFVAG